MYFRLREEREKLGMTQEELAGRLGVTPQAVSKWERGNGLPDITLVEGICKILNISANVLLGIKDNSVIENNNIIMEKEIKNNMFAEPLRLEFGSGVIPYVVEGLKTDYINQKRKALVKETGMLIPIIRIRDSIHLKENEVCVVAYDKILYKNEFELSEEKVFEHIVDNLVSTCKSNYHIILNKQIVKTMIDNMKEAYPGIADGLIPEKISYLQLQKELQKICVEKGNIRDMIHILEELECKF